MLAGHKLRIHYAATGETPQWCTVDPTGLVTGRDRAYLLATKSGADHTDRLSRVLPAEEFPEPAQRPDRVDLDRVWRERSTQFRTGGDQVTVLVRVNPERREDLVSTALAVRARRTRRQSRTVDCDVHIVIVWVNSWRKDGWLRLKVTFQDSRHAEWALWQLTTDAEALAP